MKSVEKNAAAPGTPPAPASAVSRRQRRLRRLVELLAEANDPPAPAGHSTEHSGMVQIDHEAKESETEDSTGTPLSAILNPN